MGLFLEVWVLTFFGLGCSSYSRSGRWFPSSSPSVPGWVGFLSFTSLPCGSSLHLSPWGVPLSRIGWFSFLAFQGSAPLSGVSALSFLHSLLLYFLYYSFPVYMSIVLVYTFCFPAGGGLLVSSPLLHHASAYVLCVALGRCAWPLQLSPLVRCVHGDSNDSSTPYRTLSWLTHLCPLDCCVHGIASFPLPYRLL